jgi:hypothetical protein
MLEIILLNLPSSPAFNARCLEGLPWFSLDIIMGHQNFRCRSSHPPVLGPPPICENRGSIIDALTAALGSSQVPRA